MDNEFYTLLTDRGMAKIASALADKNSFICKRWLWATAAGNIMSPPPARSNYVTKSGAAR